MSGEFVGSRLAFKSVLERGGHSTYRLMLAPDAVGERFTPDWRRLADVGCGYERATARFLAVDVPPSVDILEVHGILEDGQGQGIWTFEEGHCGHPLSAPPS